MSVQDRRSIWVAIGELLSVSSQKVHDYFHNTWSKKLCVDTGTFAEEMKELLQKCPRKSQAAAVRYVVHEVEKRHQDETLHKRTLE